MLSSVVTAPYPLDIHWADAGAERVATQPEINAAVIDQAPVRCQAGPPADKPAAHGLRAVRAHAAARGECGVVEEEVVRRPAAVADRLIIRPPIPGAAHQLVELIEPRTEAVLRALHARDFDDARQRRLRRMRWSGRWRASALRSVEDGHRTEHRGGAAVPIPAAGGVRKGRVPIVVALILAVAVVARRVGRNIARRLVLRLSTRIKIVAALWQRGRAADEVWRRAGRSPLRRSGVTAAFATLEDWAAAATRPATTRPAATRGRRRLGGGEQQRAAID